MQRLALSVFLLALLAFPIPGLCDGLRVYSGSLAPLHSRNQALGPHGYSFDVLSMILRNIDISMDRAAIEFPPWARALKLVETSPGSLLVGVARTSAREKKFFWVGPYVTLKLGLIAPKSRNLKINDAKDVKNLSIAVVQDSAPMHILQEAYGLAPSDLELVVSDDNQIRMLAAGHVDAITHTSLNAPLAMRELGIDPAEYEMIHPLRVIDLYFALNPQDAVPLGLHMQQELDRLANRDCGRFLGALLRSHVEGGPIDMAK